MSLFNLTDALDLAFPPLIFPASGAHRDLHSFPTRRSSDLSSTTEARGGATGPGARRPRCSSSARTTASRSTAAADRKSTRLNSSHVAISYAVFCLKKKKVAHEQKRNELQIYEA